jgi:hypothetical protein
MERPRIDDIARRFTELRLSRRAALRQGGGGLAAGAVAAAGIAHANAQEASPVASDAKEFPSYLYLQSFQTGSIAAREGEAGRYTLTLEHGLGQTVYFSDRPERKVGAFPTDGFLKTFGFSAKNPPNAALVVESAPGDTDIAVLELTNPTYDDATHTATYDVQLLKNYEKELGMSFAEDPSDLAHLQRSFGAAHLFIDDCADGNIICISADSTLPCPNDGICGSYPSQGYCYSNSNPGCYPCVPYDHDNPTILDVTLWWDKKCNADFPACADIPYQTGCISEFNS